MHSLKSLVVTLVLGSTFAVAQPQGEVVIRSRDGKTRIGRILSETSKGYLLSGPDGTSVVEFASITDIRQLAPAASNVGPTTPPAPPVVAAPSAPLPVAAPPMPVAAPSPVVVPARADSPVVTAPPPPPQRPSEGSVAQMQEEAPPVRTREGFHFGLGVGAMMLPAGPMAQVQAHFEFNFGRPVYRINANVGGLVLWSSGFATASIDNLFQFNVTDVYSFGLGVQVGLAFGPRGYLQVAPVIQPVIIKLGDRGQHQFSLTGSLSVVSNVNYSYYSNDHYTFAGTPQAYLGYSYLF